MKLDLQHGTSAKMGSVPISSGCRLTLIPASRLPAWPLWAVAVVLLWLAGVGTVTLLSRRAGVEHSLCAFKNLTGVPCPACGTGRMCESLLHGQVGAAFGFNPFFFIVMFGWAGLLLMRATLARTVRLELPRPWRAIAWGLVGMALLGNWVYVIRCVG